MSEFKLEIKAKNFNNDIICTGEQLTKVLFSLNKLKNVKWLAYDVYGSSKKDLKNLFKIDEEYSLFNDTKSLINSIYNVIQFEEGVFIMISNDENVIDYADGIPFTEYEEKMQILNSLLEIRMFDFSYIEIYSNNIKLLELIKNSIPNQEDLKIKEIRPNQ